MSVDIIGEIKILIIGNNAKQYEELFSVFSDDTYLIPILEELMAWDKPVQNIVITDFFEYETNDFVQVLCKACSLLNDQGEILVFCKNHCHVLNLSLMRLNDNYFSVEDVKKCMIKYGIKNCDCWYPFPNHKEAIYIVPDSECGCGEISEDVIVNACMSATNCLLPPRMIEELVFQKNYLFLTDMVYIYGSKDHLRHKLQYIYIQPRENINMRMGTALFRNECVIKYALNKVSFSHIKKIYTNLEILKSRGISVVENHMPRDGILYMPYICAGTLDSILAERLLQEKKEAFLDLVNQYYSMVKKSAPLSKDKVCDFFSAKDIKGEILEDGFTDLKFDNCFWIDGEIVVFDQEFMYHNVPLDVIVGFAVEQFYIKHPEVVKLMKKEELLSTLGVEWRNEYAEGYTKIDQHLHEGYRDDRNLLWKDDWQEQQKGYTYKSYYCYDLNALKIAFLLQKEGINRIAIYGFGKIGRLFYHRIKQTQIEVVFIIDQKAVKGWREAEVEINLYDKFPLQLRRDVDAVIVCLLEGAEKIIYAHKDFDIPWINIRKLI